MAPVYKQKTKEQIVADIRKTSSISSAFNVGTGLLGDVEKVSRRVKSPIMASAKEKLATIRNIKDPSLEMIETARKNAGVKKKADAYKDSTITSKAASKAALQRSYADSYNDGIVLEEDIRSEEDKAQSLLDLDLKELMFEGSGMSAEENLIENYALLKGYFNNIDILEDQLNDDLEGIADNKLEEHIQKRAQLLTLKDIRAYYELREALLGNVYYSVLPLDEMVKMPYKKLRERLDELYAAEDRDANLIDYYQNIIRLKELDITDVKSVEARKKKYIEKLNPREKEDDRDGKAEIVKIAKGYWSLRSMFVLRKGFYSGNEINKYLAQFFEAHQADIAKFEKNAPTFQKNDPADGDFVGQLFRDYETYKKGVHLDAEEKTSERVGQLAKGEATKLEKSDEVPEGIRIEADQAEGIRKVKAFLLRRACRENNHYGPFVHHFLQSPPQQQLVAFYLMEHGKTEAYMGSDFYMALNGYVPDLDAIKKKIRGRTFSLKWKKICDAVQAVKGMSADIAAYAELEQGITNSKEEFTSADNAHSQGGAVFKEISYRFAMIQLLYRNAGLHPDMSLDMVKDEKIRSRLYDEFHKIVELAGQIEEIAKNDKEFDAKQSDLNKAGAQDTYKEKAEKTFMQKSTSALSVVNRINGYPSTANLHGQKISQLNHDSAKWFFDLKAVGIAGFSMTSIAAFCTTVNTLYGMYNTYNAEGLTDADKTAKWLGLGSGIVTGLNLGAIATKTILNLTNIVDATSKGSVLAGDIFGGIGVVTSVAGTVASAIQLGRVKSSANDIERSKEKMDVINKSGKILTSDEEKLNRFLSHQTRDLKREKTSKYVDLARNSANMIVSYSGATGALIPIAVAAGLLSFIAGETYGFYDRHQRKEIIKKAVDEQLGVDKIIAELKKEQPELAAHTDDELKKMAREEAIAQCGYTSYKKYFKQVCVEFAQMLYRKVFEEKLSENDRLMYEDALKSLGMKITKPAKGSDDKPYPTVNAIVAKLMG